MRRREPYTVKALDFTHGGEECGKSHLLMDIGVHVLPQERDFLHALESETLGLVQQLPWGTAGFSSPHIGDNTVRTEVVTSFHYRKVGFDVALEVFKPS